jgi:hypothetical protein
MFGKSSIWSKLDPLQKFKFDYNKPHQSSIRDVFEIVKSPRTYGEFLGLELGFDYYFSTLLMGICIMPLYMEFVDPKMLVNDICSMLYFDFDSPELFDCLSKDTNTLRNYLENSLGKTDSNLFLKE